MERDATPQRSTPASQPTSQSMLAAVERFYDAAEHPERLRDALLALAEVIGCASVLLLATDGADRRLLAATHSPATLGTPRARLPVRSDRLRTIPLAGGFEVVVDCAELEPRALAALTLLTPHLARALRFGERLNSHAERHELKPAELDRLPIGVVLLDGHGQVVALNRAARSVLAACEALVIDDHRLMPHAPVSRALVDTLVDRVVSPPEPGRRFVGGRLRLADEAWGGVDLVVARLETMCDRHEVRAVVLLSAAGVATTPETRFQEIYSLAAEEAVVAVELLAGRTPSGADGQTVPQELVDALYRKLGTTRQADLLRLLLRPPGVVFEAAERARTI